MSMSVCTSVALAARFVRFGFSAYAVPSRFNLQECLVPAETEAGWVCGSRRVADRGMIYASFRGVPYAKQPIGELRFKELQPLEPWSGYYNAISEGPICPQFDVVYGRMMQPQGMSEECIYANIYVPLDSYPNYYARPHWDKNTLPIVVFIHGGNFAYGSGDSDVHGPEYLLRHNIVLITFNYRLNVFGFLSLNSSSIPGNNGLRDMVTLLRWVKRNAHAFGGNPDEVTLAGQNAGAVSAHLLSLSPVAEGLFKRVWLMSGVGAAGFYSSSPAYAQFIANLFLTNLGINSTDPEEVHRKLIDTPIEKIIATNKALLNITGLVTFAPVIESPLPGVTRIIDDDPEVLVTKGRGKGIPLVIGFTNKECETFRPRFEEIDIISQINSNPLLVVSPQLIYRTPATELQGIAGLIRKQYFSGPVHMADFINLCTDQYFKYPAIKLATMRSRTGDAPVYLYQFAYNYENNVLKEALGLSYEGAAHIEDLTYIFRVNSVLNPIHMYPYVPDGGRSIRDRMTTYFINFVLTSYPVLANDTTYLWPRVIENSSPIYQHIERIIAKCDTCRELTEQQEKTQVFFDNLQYLRTA